MNGGTYAEALKVGFTEDQAGFLARMSCETRNEALESFRSEAIKQRQERESRKIRREGIAVIGSFIFMLGYFVGRYCQ